MVHIPQASLRKQMIDAGRALTPSQVTAGLDFYLLSFGFSGNDPSVLHSGQFTADYDSGTHSGRVWLRWHGTNETTMRLTSSLALSDTEGAAILCMTSLDGLTAKDTRPDSERTAHPL